MAAHELQDTIALVFFDIAVIVGFTRLLGVLTRRVRQPSVVAEILAALALGPSLLGALPGDLTSRLFPEDVRPYLSVIAALGLSIYMFVVGLELELGLIRGRGRAAGIISVASVVMPFGMGVGLAVWLHRRHGVVDGSEVDFVPFALFIGAAMSVTAFPVLARILTERRIHRTPIGALTLACAAVDDVLAWIMLAAVLAVVQSSGTLDLLTMLAESLGFVALMFGVVRPRLRVLVERRRLAGRLTPDIFAVVLVGILVSSYITDHIGIHAIFGAFLFGAVMPRRDAEALSHEIIERVEQVTVLLLLPVFFVVTGLNVDVTALGRQGALELLAVLAVACAGKFLGASSAAVALRIRPRRAATLGVLVNTRGLTELVVLNIGLAVGVLDQQLFTVMVLMAIVTTMITEPLLRLLYPDRAVARDIAEAERAALGLSADHRVLALVGQSGHELTIDAAVCLLGTREESELLISRLDARPASVEVGSGLTSDLLAVASSLEATQALARRAAMQGARVGVNSQLTEDAVAEAVLQAEVAGADVVVVSQDTVPLGDALAARGDRVVVVVQPPGSSAATADPAEHLSHVVARAGSSEDGWAAVEQAVRCAERLGARLLLAAGRDRREVRRVAQLGRKMESARVNFESVDGEQLAALLQSTPDVVWIEGEGDLADPPMTPRPRVVLHVRGTLRENSERLDAMLSRRGGSPSL